MTIDPSAEIHSLRATVRDLLALSTIPEVWVGQEPPAIATDLADLLTGSLRLNFAFVRLRDPTGCQVVEVTRGNSWKAFPEWLREHLAEVGQISRKQIMANVGAVAESCRGIVIPIGVNSERGLVAAASDRPGFPDQIDQQLLSVAANNAATAFQNAFLINALRSAQEALRASGQALRKARDELEIKVAERTSELQRSAQELQRSESYLTEGQRLAHAGSWAFVPAGFEYWSSELFQIYMNICRNNMEDIRTLTEYAHDHRVATDYDLNETPMLEQDDHFKHLYDNPTYIRQQDWREVDALVDWLIEKNKSGYQMVNSVQRLQEMKAFVRMSSGIDLREYGWNGDGIKENGHQTEMLASMPGIVQDGNGELRFADWNCRAGQNNVIIRTDGTVAPCFPMYASTFDWGNIDRPKFDQSQLSQMKSKCQQHCFSTLNHNLAYCYDDSRMIKWLWSNVIKNKFQGGVRGFED